MVVIGKNIYLFGGQGRTMFEEMRLADTKDKHEWNWVLLDHDDLIIKQNENGEEVEGGEIADQPGPRTAAVMSRYGD
jgi:hypothetical protein